MLSENKMFIKYENRFDVLNEKPSEIPVELTQPQTKEDFGYKNIILVGTNTCDCMSYAKNT